MPAGSFEGSQFKAADVGYIGGVRLNEFIDPVSAGIFEGSQFKAADVTPIELPNNDGWVIAETESLVQKGSLAAWSTVADTKAQPRPRICLPLGVEPNKPRIISDARYLSSMCKHSLFQMDGVGKVPQCSWKGAHKSHWTISRSFTISCWLPNPGSSSGCAGEKCTSFGRYCVSDGVPPRPYTTALATRSPNIYDPKTYPTRRGSMTFGCRTSGPHATSARPAKQRLPRGGGPRTHDLLPLRLFHGLSKMLTRTHHRPGLPGRRLQYGTTQVLRA